MADPRGWGRVHAQSMLLHFTHAPLLPADTRLLLLQILLQVCLLTNPIWLIKTRMQLQSRAQPGPASSSPVTASPSPTSIAHSTLTGSNHPAAGSTGSTGSTGSSIEGGGRAQAAAGVKSAGQAVETAAEGALRSSSGQAAASSQAAAASSSSGASSIGRGGGHGAVSTAAAAVSTGQGRPYKGVFDAVLRIGREEGIRGYYKGLGPSLVLVGGAGLKRSSWVALQCGARIGTAKLSPLSFCLKGSTPDFASIVVEGVSMSVTMQPIMHIIQQLASCRKPCTARYTPASHANLG